MLNRGMEETQIKLEMRTVMSEMRISCMGLTQYYTLQRKISELEDIAIGTTPNEPHKEA